METEWTRLVELVRLANEQQKEINETRVLIEDCVNDGDPVLAEFLAENLVLRLMGESRGH